MPSIRPYGSRNVVSENPIVLIEGLLAAVSIVSKIGLDSVPEAIEGMPENAPLFSAPNAPERVLHPFRLPVTSPSASLKITQKI